MDMEELLMLSLFRPVTKAQHIQGQLQADKS